METFYGRTRYFCKFQIFSILGNEPAPYGDSVHPRNTEHSTELASRDNSDTVLIVHDTLFFR
jgi:hypothetical protein